MSTAEEAAKKPKPKTQPIPNRRDMRAFLKPYQRVKQRTSATCGRCQKLFIAKTAERCMCPVARPRKTA